MCTQSQLQPWCGIPVVASRCYCLTLVLLWVWLLVLEAGSSTLTHHRHSVLGLAANSLRLRVDIDVGYSKYQPLPNLSTSLLFVKANLIFLPFLIIAYHGLWYICLFDAYSCSGRLASAGVRSLPIRYIWCDFCVPIMPANYSFPMSLTTPTQCREKSAKISLCFCLGFVVMLSKAALAPC